MEETRLVTRKMVMIKNPTGRLRINAPQTNFICPDLQKEEKKKY